MKKQKSDNKKNEVAVFAKTFIIAFVLILIVTTPVAAWMGKTLEITPGWDPDMPVLERDLDMEVLIPEGSPFFDAFMSAKKVNVLALGVNQNLADTIMLVSLDTKNKHADLIWVPRDTYYYRDGYYGEAERKINASYRKNDVLIIARAVSEVLLGMPINYYVVFDYDGVANIVDAMGGVPMDIPFAMKYKDPLDKPPLIIDIPKGEQILDGEHAVQFLRYRKGYPEGDLGRIKAQQQFMNNAFKQCVSLELPKIAKTVYDNITSDISLKAALFLAGKGVGITGEDINTYMMPGWADPDPPYYVHPKKKDIADILAEIYSIGIIEEEEPEEGDGEK